jgi:hypothetical protein
MTSVIARAVSVYCASSTECDPEFHAAAFRLGELLARDRRTVVYGGGRFGSMGALADGALSAGGRVIGVLPEFLRALEVAHDRLTELHIVEDMRARKRQMLMHGTAVIALPGGVGTLEELLEAMTLKRLGVYFNPIIMINTRLYFDPLIRLLESAVEERFIEPRHLALWRVVASPEEAIRALAESRVADDAS